MAAAIAVGWWLSRQPKSPEEGAPASSVENRPAGPLIGSDISSAERQEVLRRIDLIPNVSAENKEQLYAHVEHAQNLRRIMTLTFEEDQTRLSEPEAEELERESREPDFAQLATDPTAVFVVLGFAGKGEEKKNAQVSFDRAQSITELLRKRCGVLNVIQSIPMGSSDLFGSGEPEKNRIVEVWTVFP